jgi:hypothetical protein
MSKHSYFYQGREISEDAALDRRGLLRDGVTARVRVTQRDNNPWADPHSYESTGQGEHGQRSQQAGDLCTLNGFPGRLKKVNGELCCVPDTKDAVGFTDHSGDPWSASRPGFRLRIGDTRKAQRDAIAEYERELTNRWRLGDQERTCSACDGSGEDEAGNDCPVCGGEGVLPAANETTDRQTAHASLAQRNDDSRPLAQRMQDHKRTMDALYRARDAELENAWRNK